MERGRAERHREQGALQGQCKARDSRDPRVPPSPAESREGLEDGWEEEKSHRHQDTNPGDPFTGMAGPGRSYSRRCLIISQHC